jgi:hypothetical protein
MKRYKKNIDTTCSYNRFDSSAQTKVALSDDLIPCLLSVTKIDFHVGKVIPLMPHHSSIENRSS